jgi:hypothetical protein
VTRAQRVYLAVCVGSIGFTLAYVLVDYAKIPRPFYDPMARSWRIAARVPGVAMGYFGLWLYALAAGAVVAAVAWLAAGRAQRPLADRTLGLLGAWTGTAWILAAAYYVWNNWP